MNKTINLVQILPVFAAFFTAVSFSWPTTGSGETIALPEMGGPDRTVLTAQREREIGEALMQELRRKHAIHDDSEVEAFIRRLGHHLASHSNDFQQHFTFFVLKDRGVNAFAAPGGYIGVNTGLILETETESELAAVLAHEIAHITQRHMARSFEAVNKLAVPSIAAMVAAVLIGTQNSDAGIAALAVTQAGALQFQIDFTRAHEQEADRVGIQSLAEAGYDPRSMPAFFERMQTATRYYGKPPEFLSTHPVTTSRIADSRSRAERFPYKHYTDSISYSLVRAKLQVLSDPNPAQVTARFRKALDKGQYRSEQATRYGYALALKRAKKNGEARAELRRLLKDDPERIPFLTELAEVELAMGNVTEAMGILERGLALYPVNKMLIQGYAHALLREGRAENARRLLTDYVQTQQPDPAIYWLLARSEEQAGDPVAAHMSLAEHYVLMGENRAAIDQLERAQKKGLGDFYQASRIEARLKQLKEEAGLKKKAGSPSR